MFAERGRLLPAFRDHEFTAGREANHAWELAHVSGLRERVRKQLVHVRLAIAVGVAQPPDPVPIEHVNLFVSDCQRQRFVQAGRESFPLEDARVVREPAHQPHITVKRYESTGAVLEEFECLPASRFDATDCPPAARCHPRHTRPWRLTG